MTQATPAPDRFRVESSDAQQLTDVVTRLRRALRTSIRTDYPWESLPMAQVELLMALADHAPAKIGRLATLQRLAPNTVSGLVQQLVEAGLASRETDPTDRRVARVTLTDAGHRQLAEWKGAHERRIGSALDRLPSGERDTIMGALVGLNHLVDQLTNPVEPEAPTPR